MTIEQMGRVVRYCRKQASLSQQQLAELAGVGKTSVFDLEKGKSTIQLNTLMAILSTLNIKLSLTPPLTLPEEL